MSWGSILELNCGFESAKASANGDLCFGVAVKNHLPVDLPITRLSIHLTEGTSQDRNLTFAESQSMCFLSNAWNLHTLEFTPGVHGEIAVKCVEIVFGSGSSLIWNLPNAGMLPNENEDPWKGTQITPGKHSKHVTFVGAPPILKVPSPGLTFV